MKQKRWRDNNLSRHLFCEAKMQGYLKINNSSILASTAREISIASFSDGLYCAFSNRIIVSLRTPTISANCSCVISFNKRYFLRLQTNSDMAILRYPYDQNDKAGIRKEITQLQKSEKTSKRNVFPLPVAPLIKIPFE